MKETIAELIRVHIENIIFYVVITGFFLITVLIVLALCKPILSKRIIKQTVLMFKFSLYMFLCGVIVMGITSLLPRIILTVDLLKDYNQQIILVKEGTVDMRLTRMKLPVIEMDGNKFILSSNVYRVKEGEYCKIEYLKYSKYVVDLKIKE